jgi:hypothetical protein
MPAPVTLHELASYAAAHRALDLLVFEHAGSWVTSTPELALRPLLATTAHQHAWHAELWAARFPSVPGLDLGAATTVARERLVDVAVALDSLDSTDERVSALFDGLVPLVADVVASHRAALDERLDPSTARVLDLVAADLARERAVAQPFVPPAGGAADTVRRALIASGVFDVEADQNLAPDGDTL